MVKSNTWFDAIGVAAPSVSLTCAETTVTVHTSFAVKLASGFSVKLAAGDAPTSANVCAPEFAQPIVNDAVPAFTVSLNTTVMSAPSPTLIALSAGVVDDTVGARSAEVVNDQVFGAAIGSGMPS